MEIIIGDAILQLTKTKIYEFQIKMMHGDGDGETKGYVRIPETRLDLIEDLTKTLAELAAVPSGYAERYSRYEGWHKWFGHEWLGDVELEEYRICHSMSSFEWDRDITYEDGWAQYDGHDVHYYDGNGTKFKVTVKI